MRRVDSQHLLVKELLIQEQTLLHRQQEMAESQSWRENPQLLLSPQPQSFRLTPGRPPSQET
jgi:hypothetical protein